MGSEDSETLGDISYHGPQLDIPDPPADLPYAQLEDYRSREIVKANVIDLTPTALIAAFESQTGVLEAAIAHAIGSEAVYAAIPTLKESLTTGDDQVAVESAYALARLGVSEGNAALVRSLRLPLEGYLGAPLAAGYLAQLGDPQGFPVITSALAASLLPTKMLACKQLYFFMPFHSTSGAGGAQIDVVSQFQRALQDPDTNIQWQALVQMRELRSPAFAHVLEGYLSHALDISLRKVAQDILK